MPSPRSLRSRAVQVVLVDSRPGLRRAWARSLISALPDMAFSTCDTIAAALALVPGEIPFILIAPADELARAPQSFLDRAEIIATADALAAPGHARALLDRAGALFERLDDPHPGLAVAVAAAARSMRKSPAGNTSGDDLVAASRAMRLVMSAIRAAATTHVPLLFLGEEGTGKRTLARLVHARGPHPERPLRELACDELGAEPQAEIARAIADAGAGSLVIDRVDRASPEVAALLVRMLDPSTLAPRLIATARHDLREVTMGAKKGFDIELFHRFAGRVIDVPPLRARDACIPVLAATFARATAERLGLPVPRIAVEAARALKAAQWPGNIPELRALVDAAITSSGAVGGATGETLTLGDFGLARPKRAREIEAAHDVYAVARKRALESFEHAFVESTLAHTGGNITRAAHVAGMDRANFRRLLKRTREKDSAED